MSLIQKNQEIKILNIKKIGTENFFFLEINVLEKNKNKIKNFMLFVIYNNPGFTECSVI